VGFRQQSGCADGPSCAHGKLDRDRDARLGRWQWSEQFQRHLRLYGSQTRLSLSEAMRPKLILLLAVLAGLWWAGVDLIAPLRAEGYSIEWYRIASGQGTSTNQQFTLSGTIGQADGAGTMRGGNYALASGFWSFISVVPTPGAPELAIALSGPRTVLISWPAPSTGFVLQQNATFNAVQWVDVTERVTSTPVANLVEVPFANGTTFYRLIQR
jgi:hypothetical protein